MIDDYIAIHVLPVVYYNCIKIVLLIIICNDRVQPSSFIGIEIKRLSVNGIVNSHWFSVWQNVHFTNIYDVNCSTMSTLNNASSIIVHGNFDDILSL